MDSLGYLIAALAVTIVGILVYVYYLGQRTRELRRDLAALERGDLPGRRR
ncbi:MAG: CcmD family protein [Chloroflexia bacterium]|nr:CcmD family protein [Chloroflexia bacterium]MDQ3328972.1 CcmD family protein [Chloroflexota bacterium]